MTARSFARRLWDSPTLTTWASMTVRAANVVVILPLLLRTFGPEEITLWYLLATVVSLQLLIDFGFVPSFSRLLAYAHAGRPAGNEATTAETPGPDWATMERMVGTMRTVYLWVACLAVAAFGVAGTALLARPIFSLESPGTGWVCWLVTLVSIAISLYGNVYVCLLQGLNEVARLRRWEAITGLGGIAAAGITLWAGLGLLALVCAVQSWVLLGILRNRWLLRGVAGGRFRRLPAARIDRPSFDAVWAAAWRSGLGTGIAAIIVQASGLVYAQFGDTAKVASYLFSLRLMTAISTFSQAPFYSKIPLLNQIYGRGDIPRLIQVAQTGMRRAHWSFVAGVMVVMVVAPGLLEYIGSTVDFVPRSLWLLLGLAFIVERYGAMHLQLYSTTNHIIWHLVTLSTGAAYLVALLLLTPLIDYYAFPTAMLFGYALFYSRQATARSHAAFGLGGLVFERSAVLPPLIILTITCLASLLLSFFCR